MIWERSKNQFGLPIKLKKITPHPHPHPPPPPPHPAENLRSAPDQNIATLGLNSFLPYSA